MSDIDKRIEDIIDYASRNFGNDVVLSYCCDKIKLLIREVVKEVIGKDEEVPVYKELGKLHRSASIQVENLVKQEQRQKLKEILGEE